MIKRWLCSILSVVLLLGMFALPTRAEATSAMTSSEALVTFVKTMEGFSAYPYSDYGQYSIGYGTRCPSDKLEYYRANGITEEEAIALLKSEMAAVESALNKFKDKHGLTWEQHQFDALVSFSYNCGTGWLSETSGNMYNAVLSGDTGNRLIYSMGLWSTAGGQFILLERRMSEASLYINGTYEPYTTSQTPYPDSYRWVFLNGGEGTVRYRVYCYDANLDADLSNILFTETPSGKTLAGWYTSSGIKVTKLDSTLQTGETLHARWTDGTSNDTEEDSPIAPLGITVTVTGTDVRIRTGPGMSYSHAGWNKKGDQLLITQIQQADGYTWGKFSKGWSAVDFTTFPSASGWLQEGTHRVYYQNGVKLTNQWINDGYGLSWVDENGYLVTDHWVTAGENTYYCNSSGHRVTNRWIDDGVGMAWVDDNGCRVYSQWMDCDDGMRYVDANGYRVTGTINIDGHAYRFDANGILLDWYTIKFQDWDGTVLCTGIYKCGDPVIAPADPSRPDDLWCSYSFAGWSPEVTTCCGAATYTATYSENRHYFPVITQQPCSVTVDAGETATFGVVTESEPISYCWEYLAGDAWESIGADTDTLSFPATDDLNGTRYRCSITFQDGTVLITEEVTLTVNSRIEPQILQQPQAVTLPSGETAQFSVAVQGDVVSYHWQYRKIWKWFDTAMEGFDSDTLTVPAVGNRNGYDYRCTITFADGTVLVSDMAKLTVLTEITDVVGPRDQIVTLGYKGQFTASAIGEGLSYQWQYKRPDVSRWFDTAMEGATKPTVLIETTTARNGYQYRCKITDVTGNVVYTEAATMWVLSFTLQPKSATAKVGSTATFTVTASVSEGFTYQWQYSRDGISWSNTTMEGCRSNTLKVSVTAARNGYQYRCVLTGSKNSKLESKVATLTVR